MVCADTISSSVADGYLICFFKLLVSTFQCVLSRQTCHNHKFRVACSYALPVKFTVIHHFEVVETVSTSLSETGLWLHRSSTCIKMISTSWICDVLRSRCMAVMSA